MTPRALLADLVAFDTTSAKTNIPIIEYLEAFLGRHGIASHPRADGGRAKVLAVRHHRRCLGAAAASACRRTPTWCR